MMTVLPESPLGPDAHPMHVHEVAFEVVNRQALGSAA
jgi:hypothetical protein